MRLFSVVEKVDYDENSYEADYEVYDSYDYYPSYKRSSTSHIDIPFLFLIL